MNPDIFKNYTAPIGVVSRTSNHINLFITGSDNQVYQRWWASGSNWSRWESLGGQFEAGAPVAVVSHDSNNIDLFVIGRVLSGTPGPVSSGNVNTKKWTSGSGWAKQWSEIPGRFERSAPIGVVSRQSNHIDLFIIGQTIPPNSNPDSMVYSRSWRSQSDWSSGWDSLDGGQSQAGMSVAVVSRIGNNIDLFITGNDRNVYLKWWASESNWSRWESLGGTEIFPPCAPVAVVSRIGNNIDLFVTGSDGNVYLKWWASRSNWSSSWSSLGGTEIFPPGAPVAVVSRTENNIDLFVTGSDGKVYRNWWTSQSNWSSSWSSLGGTERFPPGAPVAVVSRTGNNIDLFVTGRDGNVYQNWWTSQSNWSGWTSMGRPV